MSEVNRTRFDVTPDRHLRLGDFIRQNVPQIVREWAAQRLDEGFNIDQMVSEYRALRASVVKLWRARGQSFDTRDFDGLTRFNEAID